MSKKYFPIRTSTACQLKWNWSTIFLNTGITRSCHRTAESILTVDNFIDFHNTPIKIADREQMLKANGPKITVLIAGKLKNQADLVIDNVRCISPICIQVNLTATQLLQMYR